MVPTTSLGARLLCSSLPFLPPCSLLLPSLPSCSLRSPPSMCEQWCFPGIPHSSHLVVSCSPLAPSCSFSLAIIPIVLLLYTIFWGAHHLFGGKGPSHVTPFPSSLLPLTPHTPSHSLSLPLTPSHSPSLPLTPLSLPSLPNIVFNIDVTTSKVKAQMMSFLDCIPIYSIPGGERSERE